MTQPSPRRRLSLFVLLGVACLAFSLAYAGWILKTQAGPSPAGGAAPADAPMPAAVGIGHVDVEGGVTFPYPAGPGRVVDVLVREGQAVKQGDVLFRLDDFLARQDVQSAERAVRAATSKLAQARHARVSHPLLVAQQTQAIKAKRLEVEAARLKAERLRKNVGVAGVDAKDADAADKGVLALEAGVGAEEKKWEALQAGEKDVEEQIAQAEIDLEQKMALIARANYALDECAVKAKVDGTVLRLALQPGELLAASPKAPPLIYCPATPRIVRTEVEQEWAGRVELGQVATLVDYTSSGAGPTWKGRVTRVADWMAHRRSILPDPGQFFNVRTLECVVSLDPGQPPLRIGQRVKVTLTNP